MKQIRNMYEVISTYDKILAEAYNRGLEMRAGHFFYDPETKSYNDELRKKMLKVQNKREVVNVSLKRDNFYDKFENKLNYWVAEFMSYLFHPVKTEKAKQLYRKAQIFYQEEA